jgi:hypothetical protein
MYIVKHEEALRRRNALAANLPDAAEILRGSLFKRQIRHKTGCAKCEKGGGHTVWVLNVAYPGGRSKQYSIRQKERPQVEQWLKNYEELKATLEQICELNHILIRPEK